MKQTFTGARLFVGEHGITQQVQQDFYDISDAVQHAIMYLNNAEWVGIQVIAEDTVLANGRVYFDEGHAFGQAAFS